MTESELTAVSRVDLHCHSTAWRTRSSACSTRSAARVRDASEEVTRWPGAGVGAAGRGGGGRRPGGADRRRPQRTALPAAGRGAGRRRRRAGRLACDARAAGSRRAGRGARAHLAGIARTPRRGLAPSARAGSRGREGGGVTSAPHGAARGGGRAWRGAEPQRRAPILPQPRPPEWSAALVPSQRRAADRRSRLRRRRAPRSERPAAGLVKTM